MRDPNALLRPSVSEAMPALVERLGFAEEGRLREHVFVDGAYRDVVFYGLLREEWQGRA